MNTKQKKVVLYSGLFTVLSFLMWLVSGTKPLTSFSESFVWGLDLSLLISGLILVTGGFLYSKSK